MAKPTLIQTERSYYSRVETWMVEIDNETGNETLDELKAIFDTEVVKIRESAPAGSIAEMPTMKFGLLLKMKNPKGIWVDI